MCTFNPIFSTTPTLKPYNLFISHSWDYSDPYEQLVDLLNNKSGFFYANWSVPEDDPIHHAPTEDQLYQAIKFRITMADAVLVLAGMYSTYSRWINLEIRAARELGGLLGLGKPIIAIEPWGAERTSQIVKDNAYEIVGWNTDSIVDAIRKWVGPQWR